MPFHVDSFGSTTRSALDPAWSISRRRPQSQATTRIIRPPRSPVTSSARCLAYAPSARGGDVSRTPRTSRRTGGLPRPERSEALELLHRLGGELVERDLAINGHERDEMIHRDVLVGVGRERLDELAEALGAEAEARGHVVPAVAVQEPAARREGPVEV